MRLYDGTRTRLPAFVSGRETPAQKLQRLRDYSERTNQLQDAERERDAARELARFQRLQASARRVAGPQNLRIIQDVSNRLRPDEHTSRLIKYVHGRKVAEDVFTKGALGLPEDSPFHSIDVSPKTLAALSAAAEVRKEQEDGDGDGLFGKIGGFIKSGGEAALDIGAQRIEEIKQAPSYLLREAGEFGEHQLTTAGAALEALNVIPAAVSKHILRPAIPDFSINVPISTMLEKGYDAEVRLANFVSETFGGPGVRDPDRPEFPTTFDFEFTDEVYADILAYSFGDPANYLGVGLGAKGVELLNAAKLGDKLAWLKIARDPVLMTKIGNRTRAAAQGLGRLASIEANGRITREVPMTAAELLARKNVGKAVTQSVDGVPSELLTKEELVERASTLPNPEKFVDDLIEEAKLEWGSSSIVTTPEGKVGIVRTPEMGTPEEAADALADFVIGRDSRLTFSSTEIGGGKFGGFETGKGGEGLIPEPKAPKEVPTEKLPVTEKVSTARPTRRRVTGQSEVGLPKAAVPLPEPKPAPTVDSLKREFDLAIGREAGLSNREVLDNIRAGVFNGEPIDYRVANQLLEELENRSTRIGSRWTFRSGQMAAAIRRGYRAEIASSIEKLKDVSNRGSKLTKALEDFGELEAYKTYVDTYVDDALKRVSPRGPVPNTTALREQAGWKFMHDQGVPGFEADIGDLNLGLKEIVDGIHPNLSVKETQEASEALSNLIYKKGLPSAKDSAIYAKSFGPNSNEIIEAIVSAKTSLPRKLWLEAVDTANASRFISTIWDFSNIGRQSIIPAIAHPEMAATAARKAAIAAADPIAAKGMMNDFHINFARARERYIALGGEGMGQVFDEAYYMPPLFETAPDISSIEEAILISHNSFMGKLIRKGPGAGASERAYVVTGTSIRNDIMERQLRELELRGIGVTKKEVRYNGWVAQIETGRGIVPSFLKDVTPLLNPILWSTRFLLSRVEPFALMIDPRTPWVARRWLFRDYGVALGAIAGAVAMTSKIPGVSVSLDPTNLADFGVIKFGDTRIDPWGGFKPFGVLAVRLAEDAYNLDPEAAQKHLENFARSKLAPIPGKAVDIYKGTTYVGGEVSTTVTGTLSDLFTPMIAEDMIEGFNNAGGGLKSWARAFEAGAASFVGLGSNTYVTFNDEWHRLYRNAEGEEEDYNFENPAHKKFLEDAAKSDDPRLQRLARLKRVSAESKKYLEDRVALEEKILGPVADRLISATPDPSAVKAWKDAKREFFAQKRGAAFSIFGEFDIDKDSELGQAVSVYEELSSNNYIGEGAEVDFDAFEAAQDEQLKVIAKLDPKAAEALKEQRNYINPDFNALDARYKEAQNQFDTWKDIAPYEYGVTKVQVAAIDERVEDIRLAWLQETGEVYTKTEVLAALYQATPDDGAWEPIYVSLLLSNSILEPLASSDEGYQFVRQNLAQSYGTPLEDNRSLSMLFWYSSIWDSLTLTQISELLEAFPDIRDLVPEDMWAE